MSCSDSSDDEEAAKLLREAADSQFIKDSMFSEGNNSLNNVLYLKPHIPLKFPLN